MIDFIPVIMGVYVHMEFDFLYLLCMMMLLLLPELLSLLIYELPVVHYANDWRIGFIGNSHQIELRFVSFLAGIFKFEQPELFCIFSDEPYVLAGK